MIRECQVCLPNMFKIANSSTSLYFCPHLSKCQVVNKNISENKNWKMSVLRHLWWHLTNAVGCVVMEDNYPEHKMISCLEWKKGLNEKISQTLYSCQLLACVCRFRWRCPILLLFVLLINNLSKHENIAGWRVSSPDARAVMHAVMAN